MDKKVISCAFNIDTACVEIKYADGSMISIDCTLVDAEVARNMFESSELEWLVSRLWLFAQLIVPYLFIYAVSTQIPEPFCIEMVPGFSFMWIKLLSQFDIFQDFRLQYLYILLVINNQWYRIDVGKHTGQLCYLCLRHFAEAIHYLNIT